MIIEKNIVVSLHYTLTEKNAQGRTLDSTLDGEPMAFIFGMGKVLPTFEQNLEGKKAGDTFAFAVPSGDAFGDYNKDAMAEVPSSIFKDNDGKVQEGLLDIGNVVPLEDGDGNLLNGQVVELKEDKVCGSKNYRYTRRVSR